MLNCHSMDLINKKINKFKLEIKMILPNKMEVTINHKNK